MKNITNWQKESLINYWWIFTFKKYFLIWKLNFFNIFLMKFDAFFNGFLFYSILAGWSTWQWVFLTFSQNVWSFDTPDTPGCSSAVIWNRFEQFLLQCDVIAEPTKSVFDNDQKYDNYFSISILDQCAVEGPALAGLWLQPACGGGQNIAYYYTASFRASLPFY